MNDARLNQGIFGVMMLVASVANAQEYPAADFQPKVLYRDESVVVPSAPAASASATAPCVNQSSSATAAAKQETVSEFDPKYPASSFQPKVIFSQ